MKNTTLCYIERGGQYLMLHRVKKENDLNHDKWVGVGGKFEPNESPDECLRREVLEETGLTLTDYRCRGVVTFVSDEWEGEYMYLYTATGFEGSLARVRRGHARMGADRAGAFPPPLGRGQDLLPPPERRPPVVLAQALLRGGSARLRRARRRGNFDGRLNGLDNARFLVIMVTQSNMPYQEWRRDRPCEARQPAGDRVVPNPAVRIER